MLAFSTLWRFELHEPRQLLMLLCSLLQFIFLLSAPLTEHCMHRVCVCTSMTANYKPNEMIAMYYMHHFCNTIFKFLTVLIPSLIKACLHNIMFNARLMFQMLAFSTLWRFELHEPRQLLMLLCSLLQFIFLLSAPLTEHCMHRVCVCTSMTANYKPNEMIAMYYMHHFCITIFKF